jgi:hypothetical protein
LEIVRTLCSNAVLEIVRTLCVVQKPRVTHHLKVDKSAGPLPARDESPLEKLRSVEAGTLAGLEP